jgi:hypothetical protein
MYSSTVNLYTMTSAHKSSADTISMPVNSFVTTSRPQKPL